MEATPKRVRREPREPLSTPLPPPSRRRSGVLPVHEEEDFASCAKIVDSLAGSAELQEPALAKAGGGGAAGRPAGEPPAQQAAPATEAAAMATVAAVAPAASEGRGPGAEEVATLCVLRGDDEGALEFELDGKVYRVKDVAAFAEAVAAGPRPPRKSLAALRRAQQARRAEGLPQGPSSAPSARAAIQAAAPAATVAASALQRAVWAAKAELAAEGTELVPSPPLPGFAWDGPSLADELLAKGGAQ
mmetsp:Transcript_11748/g.36708  ORF Transcript_11748/g.36708 Transcript_11748/m.36708 type:complete len:246 (+) Transcript_11748:110-847(+)